MKDLTTLGMFCIIVAIISAILGMLTVAESYKSEFDYMIDLDGDSIRIHDTNEAPHNRTTIHADSLEKWIEAQEL